MLSGLSAVLGQLFVKCISITKYKLFSISKYLKYLSQLLCLWRPKCKIQNTFWKVINIQITFNYYETTCHMSKLLHGPNHDRWIIYLITKWLQRPHLTHKISSSKPRKHDSKMFKVRAHFDFTQIVFTARRYASAVLAVIVCLSVRLSVTSRTCTKMAKPKIRLTTPYDSPETLVLRRQKSWRNSNDITPNWGAK